LFIAVPFAKIYRVEFFSEDQKKPLGLSYRKKFPKLQAVFAPKTSQISGKFAATRPLPHLAPHRPINYKE